MLVLVRVRDEDVDLGCGGLSHSTPGATSYLSSSLAEEEAAIVDVDELAAAAARVARGDGEGGARVSDVGSSGGAAVGPAGALGAAGEVAGAIW